jgi:hypothetical protein
MRWASDRSGATDDLAAGDGAGGIAARVYIFVLAGQGAEGQDLSTST